MRKLILVVLAACTAQPATPTPASTDPVTYPFGPFAVAAHTEVTTDCVQITMHNDAPVFVNAVELTTGPGFHHSNWFFVPEHTFAGDDGTYTCTDRDFNEPVAAIQGGVLFAQSTQAVHEIQQFPADLFLHGFDRLGFLLGVNVLHLVALVVFGDLLVADLGLLLGFRDAEPGVTDLHPLRRAEGLRMLIEVSFQVLLGGHARRRLFVGLEFHIFDGDFFV